ncbi:MAG: NADH-quinone oxidoreductase subunit NuoG [Anaerolineae bacterium]|nr:NADH-quinone oxidoreductase subunit NuoG [Anaerolineae bacterium]
MADLVTITIDDVEYKVPNGMLLTDAAKLAADIEIPVFCSHPKLDPLGACRMCLVEQEVRGRWTIVTACTTRVADGMKFRYASEAAKQAREDTLEFILINHPLDCPICDKGGECPLQDQTLKHGPAASAFQEIKTQKQKHYPISDLIMLDQERCIICWRCIRYLEEWEDKPQLGLFQRGGETVIDFFPEQPVDAKTSGNIIDLCPVGALTNRVSRFRYRPWELKRTKSVCTHCSQGCNVRLDARLHQLRRIVARENMAVNDEWICDKGRFIHAFVDHPDRLTKPLVRDRKGGALREATWDEALGRVVERFTDIVARHGANAVGAIGSAKLSNEAAYLLQKFMRVLVGTNNVDHRGGAAVLADPRGLARIRDLDGGWPPDTANAPDLIVLVGADPAEEQPVLATFIRRAVRRRGTRLVVLHPRRIEDARYTCRGGAYVPYKPGEEAALFDAMSKALLADARVRERVSKTAGFAEFAAALERVGESAELAQVARLIAGAGRAMVLYGPSLVSGPLAEANRAALFNFALLAGCAERTYYLAPEANSVGVRDMGLVPDRLPGHVGLGDTAARERLHKQWGGYLPLDPGLTYDGMLSAASSGRLKALYLVGSDPASEGPAGRAAQQAAEFVVVQDLFLTESAQLADVVLPAVSWAETDGTFTNLERRVQRAPRALNNPHSQAAADWTILTHLAQRWPTLAAAEAGREDEKGKKGRNKAGGTAPKPWTYANAQAVLDEITRTVPMYAGLTWAALGDEGKQWPADAVPSPARRFSVPVRPATNGVAKDFPYALVTGQVLYDGGTLFSLTEQAQGIRVPTAVAVSPQDAAREGLADGQVVTVASAFGRLSLPVRVDETVQPGTVWIPASLPGAPVQALAERVDDAHGVRVRLTK